MAFIDVSEASVTYKKKIALDKVSFALEKGDILAVVGGNGAGKSTLLHVLATLLRPTSGRVIFGGEDIVRSPRAAREIMSYIPQEIALQMQLTLWDNLNFWAAMNGLKKKERGASVERVIKLLELEPFLKTKAQKLSGGIKRRANIAAALYNNPKILLMDEVTAGIDKDSRKKIMDFILEERNKGTTIIFVTHIADEINFLNDKIMRLNDGRMEFFGKVSECPACF